MTNKELKTLQMDHLEECFAIGLDNNMTLLLDYNQTDPDLVIRFKDIKFETLIDGTEVFYVPHVDKQSSKTITYSVAHVTALIEYVGIMDAGYADYRPQVNGFK